MHDYQTMKLMHRHGPDHWVAMEEGPHHAPAAHDPERSWLRGARILRCGECGDEVAMVQEGPAGAEAREG